MPLFKLIYIGIHYNKNLTENYNIGGRGGGGGNLKNPKKPKPKVEISDNGFGKVFFSTFLIIINLRSN